MRCIPLLVLLASVLSVCVVDAFSVSGRVQTRVVRNHVGGMEMKRKGKRVAIQDRGEFMKRKRMLDAREEAEAAAGGDDDSVPTFEIFVRPKAGGLWIPAGNLKGDNRATALVNAVMSGFMTDLYKGQLETGVAKSMVMNRDQMARGLIDNYKPFSKLTPDQLIFGFKVKYKGYEEKMGEQKVTELVDGMDKGWIDNLTDGFKNIFGNN